MTKKEKAELERGRSWRALRWSEAEEIAPDLPIPKYPNVTTGWVFNTYNKDVRLAWSESSLHGYGAWSGDYRRRQANRDGIALYSTEELALRALRCAVEREAAEHLLALDERIAQCRLRPCASPPNAGGAE